MTWLGRGGGEQPLAGCAGATGTSGSGEVPGGSMGRAAGIAVTRCLAGVGLVLLAGCTMCPDPYDYSGPVPNGSVPQNDFRARSNGILPLGAAPRPWPPIVRRDAGDRGVQGLVRRSGTPTPAAEPVTVAAAETPADPAEARSVLVVVAGEEPRDTGSPSPDPWAVVPDFDLDAHAGDAERSVSEPAIETASTERTVDVPPVNVEVPLLTETPGWRERTPR